MFPNDPGEESVRSTVHGWKLTRNPDRIDIKEDDSIPEAVTPGKPDVEA
jgi:hypothetical protein